MPIPDFQTLMRPLLELGAERTLRARDAVEALSERFGLAPEEREALLPSGGQTTIFNRTHWAITHL